MASFVSLLGSSGRVCLVAAAPAPLAAGRLPCLSHCSCLPDMARHKASGELVALKKLRMERERDGALLWAPASLLAGCIERGRCAGMAAVAHSEATQQSPRSPPPAGMPVTSVRELRVLQTCRHPNLVELKRVVTGALRSAALGKLCRARRDVPGVSCSAGRLPSRQAARTHRSRHASSPSAPPAPLNRPPPRLGLPGLRVLPARPGQAGGQPAAAAAGERGQVPGGAGE